MKKLYWLFLLFGLSLSGQEARPVRDYCLHQKGNVFTYRFSPPLSRDETYWTFIAAVVSLDMHGNKNDQVEVLKDPSGTGYMIRFTFSTIPKFKLTGDLSLSWLSNTTLKFKDTACPHPK